MTPLGPEPAPADADGPSLDVALYARVSTRKPEQEASIPAQLRGMVDFCMRTFGGKMSSYEAYTDKASGASTRRPGLLAMLRSVEERRVGAVVVHRIDRLSRTRRDLAGMLRTFGEKGVQVLSVTEPFDTRTAAGRMTVGLLGMFAQMEREALSERVGSAMRQMARAGRLPGGKPSYGYALDQDGRIVEEPGEAALVREMYDLYVREGLGFSAMAKALNTRGVRTRAGRLWCVGTLSHMLKNPAYVGEWTWGGARAQLYPPILDRKVFDEAIAIRRVRVKRQSPKVSSRVDAFLLSGIIRCGLCGCLMRGMGYHKPSGSFHYYCDRKYTTGSCTQGGVKGVWLDAQVADEIRRRLLDADFLARVWSAACSLLGPRADRLKSRLADVDARIAGAEREHEAAFTDFELGRSGLSKCAGKAEREARRILRLRGRKRRIEADLASLGLPPFDAGKFVAVVRQFDKALAHSPNLRKKLWMRQLVSCVSVLDAGQIKARFRIPTANQMREPLRHLPDRSVLGGCEVFFEARYRSAERLELHGGRFSVTVSLAPGARVLEIPK